MALRGSLTSRRGCVLRVLANSALTSVACHPRRTLSKLGLTIRRKGERALIQCGKLETLFLTPLNKILKANALRRISKNNPRAHQRSSFPSTSCPKIYHQPQPLLCHLNSLRSLYRKSPGPAGFLALDFDPPAPLGTTQRIVRLREGGTRFPGDPEPVKLLFVHQSGRLLRTSWLKLPIGVHSYFDLFSVCFIVVIKNVGREL